MRTLSLERVALACLLGFPAAVTLYFSFTGGGFFAGATGVAAALVWVLLALRMVAADHPIAGLSRPLGVAAAALGLFALWTLVSAFWSDSAARALIEFDRALLYLGLLLVFGSLARTPSRVEWALRALFVVLLAVGAIALISRVLPELISIDPTIAADRLSYPLSYWNGLGLFAGLGLILAVHFGCSVREPPALRVLGAAAAPVLATALYFTLSRGAIAATVAGLLLYLAAARPRGAVAGLLAMGPAGVLAVKAAYDADLLVSQEPTAPAAVAQGEDAALAIGLAVVLAAVLRLAGLALDSRLARLRRPTASPAVAALAGAVTLVAVLLVAWFALDAGERLERHYDGFVSGSAVDSGGDERSRLTDPGNNGRLDHWRVALDAFEADPLLGTGAGTYAITWARERPYTLKVEDAHSLYVEALSELGVPGLALVLVAILTILFGFARGLRGARRDLYAALFAMGCAWALHAGIDWDWELPAVSAWFFALGGLALAADERERVRAQPPGLLRVTVALGCLVLAVSPALMAFSQARLNDAVDAFTSGDCSTAIDSALDSVGAMPPRPQPFEVLGYCDVRLGLNDLAVGAMESGVDRDPENWELHYGLALARAAAGLDPRPAAREALRLNPRGDLPRELAKAFATEDPRKWKRRALRARLPIR